MNLEIKSFDMDYVLRNPTLYYTARLLTLAPVSGMNLALNRYEMVAPLRSIDAKALFGYVGDEAASWALLAGDPETDPWRHRGQDNSVCFQVYVAPKWRRHGFGTQLLNTAEKLASPRFMKVYDRDAPQFFKQHMKSGRNINSIDKHYSGIW